MTASARIVARVAAGFFVGFSALACHGAPGPTVKIEVSAVGAAADRAPMVFGYGGNIWWISPVVESGVAQRILGMDRLGMTRLSLGDQILAHANSMEDLRHRLENYPLNEFLRQYAKAGGKVLFILDGVPVWASSNKSTKKLPSPDQSIFRMSPPADFEEWSRVVEAIVRHFNVKLGLNAYYESWNEPSWYYLGTTEQYHKQYYHSVLGARRADPRALIGGPAASEILAIVTRGDPNATQAEKLRVAQRFADQGYAFMQFLQFAGQTPVPELGLKRLPVDFFSWHAYYVDPTAYYRQVVPAIRSALTRAGYPADTPLFNTEWNIAPEPPYPEGNLNATEVGAAFVATSLLAMHEAGVDGQIFQAYVDPGEPGVYLGGMFTQTGIPRANYHAFRLFSRLKGVELRTRTSDPWVSSVAFQDDANIYLMVAAFVPTPKMIANTLPIQSALANEQFTRSVAAAAPQLAGKKELPEPLASKAREIGEHYRKIAMDATRKAAIWKSGLTLEISLPGTRAAPGKVAHYLIDSTHSNIYRDLQRAERLLADRQGRMKREILGKLVSRLQGAGVPKETAERLRSASGSEKAVASVISRMPAGKREAVAATFREIATEARDQLGETMREIENMPSARLHEDSISWPPSGNLKITTEPYAVHLFVVPK